MRSYVDQPGLPLVTIASACGNGQSTVTQQRFYFDHSLMAQPSSELWTIPLCMRAGNAGPNAPETCELISQREQKIKVPACTGYLNQNVGGEGYYRSDYSPEETKAIVGSFENSLSPVERLTMLENEWALARIGRHPIRLFMDMVKDTSADRTHGVWDDVRGHLTSISEDLVSDQDRQQFQQFARDVASPVMKQLGWSARPNDNYEDSSVRASAFYVLGYLGQDPQAMTEANKVVKAYMKNPASADPMLAGPAMEIAASHGDAALYDRLLANMKKTKIPEVYYRYLSGLTEFQDPALLQRTLQLALSPTVRSQDTPLVLAQVFRNPAGRQLAWDFVGSHWPEVKQKTSLWGGMIVVRSAAAFCSPQAHKQVQDFFTQHPLPAAQRTFRQTLEQIDACVSFKSAQQPNLAAWLNRGASAAK